MTLVRRWVAIAVVVPLLVAGCSDDPEPTFEEPTETPSPTETTSEPSEPEAWEVRSEAGAVAFAEHWFEIFNDSKKSGNTEELRDVSSADCESCAEFATFLEDLYDEGGTFESDGWKVVNASQTAGLQEDGGPRVALRIRQSPEAVHYAKPPRTKTFPGGMVTYSASLEWFQGAWVMSRLDLVT